MFTQSYGQIKVDVKNNQMKLPNGLIINEDICSDICLGYERMCTANYLMDSYGIKTITEAWQLADKARKLMDDYGISETEAIEQVLNEN